MTAASRQGQKYAKRILDRTFEASRPQRKDDTLMVSTYQQQATAQIILS